MVEQYFYDTPTGWGSKKIPKAKVAETLNSQKLVLNQEADAFYFRALEKKGIYLNKPQIEAVRYTDGSLLTLAGAGSGKTSVLVCRTGYLMTVKKVNPRNILLITFTKKASEEMKERISDLPGISKKMAWQVQASTFHAFFLKLLRSQGFQQVILSSERYKQIIIKQILKKMGVEEDYQAETLLSLLSSYKMNRIPVDQLPDKKPSDLKLKQIFAAYEQWKQEHHQFDFDDILVESERHLRESPLLLKALQTRFRYIMVDEFQDTNLVQYELIKMIARHHQNLFVVGDDDQTIYSFNGARNEFILQFDQEFPKSKTITLDINYRSPDSIVGLGNAIIQNNKRRKVKTLKTTRVTDVLPKYSRPTSTDVEAERIVEDIKMKVAEGHWRYQDIAILHRTQSMSRAMFEQLTLEEIPFVSYSNSNDTFYDQRPVKAVISHFRLAFNPRNLDAISEVIPTLYINRERGMKFILNKERGKETIAPLLHLLTFNELKEYQREKVKERVQFIEKLKTLEPSKGIRRIREQFYDRFLETNERQNATKVKADIDEVLDELESSANRFKTLSTFLEFIDEMIEKHRQMRETKRDSAADVVSLMTIHKSKGTEFPVVYLIGVSEGILPHITALDADKLGDMVIDEGQIAFNKVQKAIEEERRLFYVAVTRAKKQLYISSPAEYRGRKAGLSRYLKEAFPEEKQSSITMKTQGNHSQNSKVEKPARAKKTVLAWICTSHSCNAWQRISSYEQTEIEGKACPLCGTEMEKGGKEI